MSHPRSHVQLADGPPTTRTHRSAVGCVPCTPFVLVALAPLSIFLLPLLGIDGSYLGPGRVTRGGAPA